MRRWLVVMLFLPNLLTPVFLYLHFTQTPLTGQSYGSRRGGPTYLTTGEAQGAAGSPVSLCEGAESSPPQ